MPGRYGTRALRDLFLLFTSPKKRDTMRLLQVVEPESVQVGPPAETLEAVYVSEASW